MGVFATTSDPIRQILDATDFGAPEPKYDQPQPEQVAQVDDDPIGSILRATDFSQPERIAPGPITAPPIAGRVGRLAVEQGFQSPDAQNLNTPPPGYVEDIERGLARGVPTGVRQVMAAGEAVAPAGPVRNFFTGQREYAESQQGEPPRTIPGQIAESVPAFGGAIAAGAAATTAAPLVGVPAALTGLVGLATGAATAGVQSGGEQFADAQQRLIERGFTPQEARAMAQHSAGPVAAFSAVTNTVPMGRYVARFAPKLLQAAIFKLGNSRITKALVDAAAEGTQEASEQLFQAVMQRIAEDDPKAYDDLGKQVGLAALGGGVLGGGAGIVLEGAGVARHPQASEHATSVPAQPAAEPAPVPRLPPQPAPSVAVPNPPVDNAGVGGLESLSVLELVDLAKRHGVNIAQPRSRIIAELRRAGVAPAVVQNPTGGDQQQAAEGEQGTHKFVQAPLRAEAAVSEASQGQPQPDQETPPPLVVGQGESPAPASTPAAAPTAPATDSVLRSEFESRSPGHKSFSDDLERVVADGTLSAPGADGIREWIKGWDGGLLERIKVGSADVRDPSGSRRLGVTIPSKDPNNPVRRYQINLLSGLANANTNPESGSGVRRPDAEAAYVMLEEVLHVAIAEMEETPRQAVRQYIRSKPPSYWRKYLTRGMQTSSGDAKYAASSEDEILSHIAADYALTHQLPDQRLKPIMDRWLGAMKRVIDRLRKRPNIKPLVPVFDSLWSGKRLSAEHVAALGRSDTTVTRPSVQRSESTTGSTPKEGSTGPSQDPTRNSPKSRVLSRPAVEKRLIERAEEMQLLGEDSDGLSLRHDESELGSDAFRVAGPRLPTEIMLATEHMPHARMHFSLNAKRGATWEEARARMGDEAYWNYIERVVNGRKGRLARAKQFFSGPDAPMDVRLLNLVHEGMLQRDLTREESRNALRKELDAKGLDRKEARKQARVGAAREVTHAVRAVPESHLPDGTRFKLGGEEYTLTTKDGRRMIVDGESLEVAGLDIPFDPGTLEPPASAKQGKTRAEEARERMDRVDDTEIPFARRADDVRDQIGLYSGDKMTPDTGKQGGLFADEGKPAAPDASARLPGESDEDFRIRTKFRAAEENTGKLFARKADDTDPRSENFRRWFGASKVVNEDGSPKVVYHGTSGEVDVFKKQGNAGGELGFWFTASPDTASYFAGARRDAAAVMPVYLSIKNPMEFRGYDAYMEDFRRVSGTRDPWDTYRAFRRSLMRRGFDGVVIRNSNTDTRDIIRDDWVAFNPRQIKSATGNAGTFDPKNPDISFSRRAEDDQGDDPESLASLTAQQARADIEKLPQFKDYEHEYFNPSNGSHPHVRALIDARNLHVAQELERLAKDVPEVRQTNEYKSAVRSLRKAWEEGHTRTSEEISRLIAAPDTSFARAADDEPLTAPEREWIARIAKSTAPADPPTPLVKRARAKLWTALMHPVSAAGAAARDARLRLSTAEHALRSLKGAGAKLADDIAYIDNHAMPHAGKQISDSRDAFKGFDRETRETAMKLMNQRRPALFAQGTPERITKLNDEVREILDRDMAQAAKAGYTRRGKPIKGGGRAFPEGPNEFGRKQIEKAHDKGLGSPEVAAWADREVAAKRSKTPEEALAKLLKYRESRLRGAWNYVESYRFQLPEEWIEWDPAKVLPAHFLKAAYMVEAAKRWGGPEFPKAYERLGLLASEHDMGTSDLAKRFIQSHFGGGETSTGASRQIAGALSNYETASKLGVSWLSALRNFGQRFTNTIRYEPGVVFEAAWKYPPLVNSFFAGARELRRRAERAGAIDAPSELALPDADARGASLAKLALKVGGFSATEHGNKATTSVIATIGLQHSVDRLMRSGGPETRFGKVLESALSATGFRDPRDAHARNVEKAGISPERLVDILSGGKMPTEEELDTAMLELVKQTQFAQTLATEPLWWRTSPWGRALFKFKTFGTRQVGVIWRDVAQESMKGNLGPLTRFIVAMIVSGELYQLARDLLLGEDKSASKALFKGDPLSGKQWAARVVHDFERGGGLGLISDAVYGWQGFLGGPLISTIESAASFAVDAVVTPLRGGPSNLVAAARKLVEREVPAVRQIEGAADEIDSRFINQSNRVKALKALRGSARDFAAARTDEKRGTGPAASFAADIIEGVAGREPTYDIGPYTATLRLTAMQIDAGDIDDAAAFLKAALKGTETSEQRKSLARSIKQSRGRRSPLGSVAEKDREAFLKTLSTERRRKAEKLQADWLRDYDSAIKKATQK